MADEGATEAILGTIGQAAVDDLPTALTLVRATSILLRNDR